MEDNPLFNFLCQENNARAFYLLQHKVQREITETLLSSNEHKPWISSSSHSFPHILILDLSALTERPKNFHALGFKCWHAYTSNPSVIRLSISLDGERFLPWQSFEMELKAGLQVFKFKEKIQSEIKWMKIEIVKNYDTSVAKQKTYINQIVLYDEQWIEAERKNRRLNNRNIEYNSQGQNFGKILSQGTYNSMQMIYSDEYIRPDSFQTLETNAIPDKSTIQTLDPSPFSLKDNSVLTQQQMHTKIPLSHRIQNLEQTLNTLNYEAAQQHQLLNSLNLNSNPQIVEALNEGYEIVIRKINTIKSQLLSLQQVKSGTSQFVLQNEPQQPVSKEELVKECMQQCKIYIEQELQKVVVPSQPNSNQSSHRLYHYPQQQQTGDFRPQNFGLLDKHLSLPLQSSDNDKENQHPNIQLPQQSAKKLECTLENSINNFIDSHLHPQEGDYSREIEEDGVQMLVNQSKLSVNSSMVNRMADQLQQRLENKAQRLRQLQQQTLSESEQNSEETSVISSQSSTIRKQKKQDALDQYLVQN